MGSRNTKLRSFFKGRQDRKIAIHFPDSGKERILALRILKRMGCVWCNGYDLLEYQGLCTGCAALYVYDGTNVSYSGRDYYHMELERGGIEAYSPKAFLREVKEWLSESKIEKTFAAN